MSFGVEKVDAERLDRDPANIDSEVSPRYGFESDWIHVAVSIELEQSSASQARQDFRVNDSR
jgi:hypothetical protein